MDYQLDTRLELKSAEADGQWGKFSGIATTSDEDLAGDVIEAGAFEPINVPTVAMLTFHDPSSPVGKWTSLTQQGRRLIAKGALLLSLPKGREVYDMLKGGVLNGLSVGFRPEASGVAIDARGRRTISKGKLLEISLVSVPANARCRVTETLAYSGGGLDLAGRLAALDASWQQDLVGQQRRLIDIEGRFVDHVVAAAAAGELTETQARAMLTDLRDGWR